MLEKMRCDPVGVNLDSSLALRGAEEVSMPVPKSEEACGGLTSPFCPCHLDSVKYFWDFLDDTFYE